MNRLIFTDEDFACSAVTDRPLAAEDAPGPVGNPNVDSICSPAGSTPALTPASDLPANLQDEETTNAKIVSQKGRKRKFNERKKNEKSTVSF